MLTVEERVYTLSEILETAANRIIEITENGCLDRQGTYDEFIEWRKDKIGGSLML